jgi:putative membrane protein
MSHQTLLDILSLVVSAVALMITAFLMPGFEVKNFFSAFIAAIVIGCANYFIKPILIFLTFPITIITLGLFLFVVNGIILKMCAAILPGFEIKSWWSAILGSLVLSIVGTVLHAILV